MKTDKLEDLAGWISLLRSSVVDAERKDEAKKEASKIARELFPPMAKALAWDVDGVAWLYSVTKVWKIAPGSKFVAEFMEGKIGLFDSEAEAKAACEAHHQQRFLEQLA